MNLYEIEQNENLKSDRAKCEAAKDWQTREIQKLTAVIKDLTDKLQAVTAERDEYKSICEKQFESGWEFVDAKKAVLLTLAGERVVNVDMGREKTYEMEDITLSYAVSTPDQLYIDKLEEA